MYPYKKLKIDGKCIDEHRYVWQINFGEIPKGYVVHHINGDKRDNDISNLECIPRGKHSKNHFNPELFQTEEFRKNASKRAKEMWNKRRKEMEEIPEGFSRCICCKKILPLNSFHKNKSRPKGITERCKDCRRFSR